MTTSPVFNVEDLFSYRGTFEPLVHSPERAQFQYMVSGQWVFKVHVWEQGLF